MMTLEEAWQALAAMALRLPEGAEAPARDGSGLGSNPALEARIAGALETMVEDPELGPAAVPPDLAIHLRLRLEFALTQIRRMEEEQPELKMTGAGVMQLLRHAVLEKWPLHGEAWLLARFGPR